MIYFVSIFSLVFLLSFTDFSKKFSNLGTNISIVLLSMLAGFRNVGGKDFETYRFLYDTGLSIGDTEIGYNFLNTLFHNIGISYNIFLFIISLFSIFVLVKALQKISVYPQLSLLLYIGTYFFFYDMVLNRQMIAISLLLWVMFFWEKNKIYSISLLILAFLFHKSIIIVFPFLLIFEFAKNKKYKWMFLFVLGIILALVITPKDLLDIIITNSFTVNNRLSGYILQQENSLIAYNVEIFEYIKLIIMIFIVIPVWKQLYANKKTLIWLFFYFVGAIFLLWSSKYEIMSRLYIYFDLSFIVLFAYCLEAYIHRFSLSDKQFKFCIYFIVGILAIISVCYRAYNFGDFLSEYQFYFMETLV